MDRLSVQATPWPTLRIFVHHIIFASSLKIADVLISSAVFMPRCLSQNSAHC